MNTPRVQGNRTLAGTFGTLWLDGEEIFEIESFEATVTFEREEVTMAGNSDVDSKIVGQSGEGTFTIKKVFSRGLERFVEMVKTGKDVRSQLIGKIQDPDTIGGQAERVSIDNVWFDDFTLMSFEMGDVIEDEYSFGFAPSSIEIVDQIEQ